MLRQLALYSPTLVLLAWAIATEVVGRSDALSVVGLCGLALALAAHVREERRLNA